MKFMPALQRNWLPLIIVFYGVFVFLPFLAPLLMKWNFTGLGEAIYFLYGFICHQLPQRSLFFFGPKLMYSLNEIQAVWPGTEDLLVLRQFIGNPQMGWKVAWSDRMISAYGSVWLAGVIWAVLKKYIWRIPAWMFIVLALPMVLDGLSHFISDFSGMANGFRYTNEWLAVLTQNNFSDSFYKGDALGSFNSWARWLTGILFGFGLVWWGFPYIGKSLHQSTQFELPKNINV
jgi:uncharacterized membrane protein